MTDQQKEQVTTLGGCTFSPGSFEKRFVRDMVAMDCRVDLSERQAAFLNRLAHSYRRQMGRCLAEKPCRWCAGEPMRRRA